MDDPETPRPRPHHHHAIKIARLEALIDGIFAFAMTLLVLNLVIPRGLPAADLNTTLRGLTSNILIYCLSFLILGNFWTIINWHATHIERSDTVHLWIVIFMLMFVAMEPFSTFMLAEYSRTVTANVFFAADFTLISLFLAGNWFYATEARRLVDPHLSCETISRGRRRTLLLAGVGAFVLVASFLIPRWTAFIYLAIPVLFILPEFKQGGE